MRKTLAIQLEEIEDVSDNLLGLAAIAERRLQRLKAAFAFGVENDGFHVHYRVLRLQFFDPGYYCWKAISPIVAIAGK